MALPTITERPIKELVTGIYSYFDSRWNALHNPVVYKILNDKWPTNNLDASDAITAQADDNGNVQFTIAGHSYNALEWVTIAGSSVTSYNGTWQIIDTAANTITLDLSYEAGAIGGAITATLYYQNYHYLIQVYAGIPAAHVLSAEDPIALVATIKAKPADDNIALVDVSALARDHINLLNELGIPDNDVNLWTGIYIKFAESYDTVSAGEVVQFTSSYTDDISELIYGVQGKQAFQNEYGGNYGTLVLNGLDSESKFLTKFTDPMMWADRYFDISFILDSRILDAVREDLFLSYHEVNTNQLTTNAETIEVSRNPDNTIAVNGVLYDQFGQTIRLGDGANVNKVRTFNFYIDTIVGTPTKQFDFVVYQKLNNSIDDEVYRLADITIIDGWNTVYFAADLGPGVYVFMIEGQAGGTLDNANRYDVSTDSTNPYAFGSLYAGLSPALPVAIADDLICYLEIDPLITITDLDEGIYRLQMNNRAYDSETAEVRAYLRQQEEITQNSTFDGNMAPWGNIDRGQKDWVFAVDEVQAIDGVLQESNWLAQIVSLEANREYHWRYTPSPMVGNHTMYISGWNGVAWVNFETLVLTTSGSLSGKFTTTEEYTIFGCYVVATGTVNFSITTFDLYTVRDTPELQIGLNSECENQSIYLTWLNNLGGWDYWNFTAEKEHGVSIDGFSEFDTNIFENWDDNFINGETITGLESVTARNTKVVRSQFLTADQAEAIANIKTSIRVQEIREDGTKITVLVDKDSFKIREDRQKLHTIEFSIRYTDLIPIQDA